LAYTHLVDKPVHFTECRTFFPGHFPPNLSHKPNPNANTTIPNSKPTNFTSNSNPNRVW